MTRRAPRSDAAAAGVPELITGSRRRFAMLLRQLTVRIALAITLTALLVGCSGSGGVAPPRDVVEEAVGHYASGFEVSALVPCGSSERWWTTGIPDAEYR